MKKLRFAVYDMDRTITKSGTYTPFLLFWCLKRQPWRLLGLPAALLFMLAYACKLISRGRLKTLMLALLLGQPRRSELAPVIDQFADRLMARHVYPQALAQIRADQSSGARVVLATASYDFYVETIARRLGIVEVIATKAVWSPQDQLLPAIDGENCYGAAKRRMVEAYFQDVVGLPRDQVEAVFYSDHHSDLPTFEWSDEPIAVNPNAKLTAIAQAKQWKILDWRL